MVEPQDEDLVVHKIGQLKTFRAKMMIDDNPFMAVRASQNLQKVESFQYHINEELKDVQQKVAAIRIKIDKNRGTLDNLNGFLLGSLDDYLYEFNEEVDRLNERITLDIEHWKSHSRTSVQTQRNTILDQAPKRGRETKMKDESAEVIKKAKPGLRPKTVKARPEQGMIQTGMLGYIQEASEQMGSLFNIMTPKPQSLASSDAPQFSMLSALSSEELFRCPLRKLTLFGQASESRDIRFRWPAKGDIQSLNAFTIPKLQKIITTGNSSIGLASIQLIFDQGLQSPLFDSQAPNQSPRKTFKMSQDKTPVTFQARVVDDKQSNTYITTLVIKNSNGSAD